MKTVVTSVWSEGPDCSSTWLPAIDHENLPSGSFLAVALVSTVEAKELQASVVAIRAAHSEGVDNDDVAWTNDNVHVDYSDGKFVVSHDYFDSASVLIEPDQLIGLIEWRLAILESLEFSSQDAIFESFAIEFEIVPTFEEYVP